MKRVAVLFLLIALLAIPAAGAGPSQPEVSADVRTLVAGNNAFAFDLYSRLREKKGNLFYSPYSISTALAMTSAGARGETAEQINKALHFTLDSRRLHPAFAELIRDVNGRGLPRDYQLNVAQSLWGDCRLDVRTEIQSLIQGNYGARLRLEDFRDQPDESRQKINHWVEGRTNGKIKDLLHKEDIDSRTVMVLVNAIYFKAAWLRPFETDATREEAFYTAGKKKNVAMMHQAEQFPYAEGDGFQALELPYEGGDLSMVVLLPREKDGLGKLEQSLTAAKLERCLSKMTAQRINVALPRFKIEDRFDLKEQLQAMGMKRAFGDADFSGISTTQPMMISKVIHQSFVKVDEKGTEAAAATAVIAKRPLAIETAAFRADHPFLFLLRDTHTGSILFLGRVTNPS